MVATAFLMCSLFGVAMMMERMVCQPERERRMIEALSSLPSGRAERWVRVLEWMAARRRRDALSQRPSQGI